MTDNELLLTMSDLLDKKLKPVNDRLQKIELAQENDILPRLQKIELTQENDILPRLKKVELTQENDILPRLKKVELTQENDILPRLKKIELTQENDILPRLQNIESCYISTFKRYQAGVEQIEAIQTDTEVMKSVIREHSEKLQRLA